MHTRPTLILDAHWRQISELFSPQELESLHQLFEVVWGKDTPIPAEILEEAWPRASVLIAASPRVDASSLARAPQLHTIIEVSGAFPDTVDYQACGERGVEVLSCAPGFQESVAEMALAMTLAGARGLINEHENFRTGTERWLNDNTDTDFTLFNSTVGFVGFGSIARATRKVMQPFNVNVMAHDPWLDKSIATTEAVELVEFDELLQRCRVVFITAAPTQSNYQMLDARAIALMQQASLLVVISRAHLIDFEAVVDAVASGHIRLAIDVFPDEPLANTHRLRALRNVILSPHRAAAVAGGRQLIGRMIINDLQNTLNNNPARQLQVAQLKHVAELASVGDAHKVALIAGERDTSSPVD
ncbi:NAD(P)-dependent oxidoreductase [Granulosicoccus antarcticus]|uniref:Hydroxypyruvate reductase n=1 Tax=Granulosicoccus antarcticus IMCC3135 TaxID=1192854 RepID=A0A2Z2NII1_9GAMM|nr:NAD(P)-dependent oxidoreductase [Granulosicoccus antarcticus]ASJ70959.1 Hydroxypyruvate reductase [Granulosicoccus antarcticus IMCC3135]